MSEEIVENQIFDLQKLNKDVLKLYKKAPLNTIVPAGFTGDDNDESDFLPVPDTCNIDVARYLPNLDDLEKMGVEVIDLVPSFGPLLQSFYAVIRNRTKEKVLDKEDCELLLNEKIEHLRKELEVIIDSKIEKSKIENYKKQCNAAFEGINNSSFLLLMEDLEILKLKLSNGIIENSKCSFLTGLRDKFTIFRDNMLSLITVYRDPQILPHVYLQFVQLMYLYIFCMLNIINYWYQYGFDSRDARGTPAVENAPECLSFRQFLNKNIGKSLKAMQNSLGTNQKGLENLSKMLECDVLLYPVPLFKAPVIPSINVLKNNLPYSTPVVNINVNMHARPFIYRIDGVNFIGDWETEESSGFPRRVPTEPDQITGCIGFYISSVPQITVKLNKPKYISLRLFTKMFSKEFDLELSGSINQSFSKHDYKSGSLAPNPTNIKTGDQSRLEPSPEFSDASSGFCISNKSSEKCSEHSIRLVSNQINSRNVENKLLFVEVVVLDE